MYKINKYINTINQSKWVRFFKGIKSICPHPGKTLSLDSASMLGSKGSIVLLCLLFVFVCIFKVYYQIRPLEGSREYFPFFWCPGKDNVIYESCVMEQIKKQW